MPTRVEDRVALRVTPLVFAAVFAMGAWADPLGVLTPIADWTNRATMAVAAVASIAAAVRPRPGWRFVALACGTWATISRGLTLIIVGQDNVPRKSEVIGGSVWMAVAYLVLFSWLVTVPLVDGLGRHVRQ